MQDGLNRPPDAKGPRSDLRADPPSDGPPSDGPPSGGPADRQNPMSSAMEWVSRIMAMSMAMVAPILAGVWLDRTFQSRWFTPAAACVGMVLGMTYLLTVTRSLGRRSRTAGRGRTTTPRRQTGNGATGDDASRDER